MSQPNSLSSDLKLKSKLAKIKLLALDVDGVMTDGSVTYDSNGQEHKSFNIKDGLGIKLAQKAGVRVAIITGRNSEMVSRRAEELGIDFLIQGREDKETALNELIETVEIPAENIAYMGDDLPDYRAIKMAGIGAAPADAHKDVKSVADIVTDLKGGRGAVREICDLLLKSKNKYDIATADFK